MSETVHHMNVQELIDQNDTPAKQCGETIIGRRGPVRGPCLTCGVAYRSYGAKKYCSMRCYQLSPECQQRLRTQARAILAKHLAVAGFDGNQRLQTLCLFCETLFFLKPSQIWKKKYCSTQCYRAFMEERFDRWIANPESIALPQCYDEFLLQHELPCLIDGCEWVGEHLGTHVNLAHGLVAREFKKIAGFNVTTGLVTPRLSQALGSRPHLQDCIASADFLAHRGKFPVQTPDRSLSLEGREHLRKGQAVARQGNSQKRGVCRQCGADIVLPITGVRYYCSIQCRTTWKQNNAWTAEVICAYCGISFQGSHQQSLRYHRDYSVVVCSMQCRSRLNARRLAH